MPRTQVRSDDIGDSEVKRQDLNITTPSEAVIRKVVAGDYISLSETGADPGTGDVTINVTPVTGDVYYRLSYLFGENGTSGAYLHVGSSEKSGYTITKQGKIRTISYYQTSATSKTYDVRINGTTVASLNGSSQSEYDNSLDIDVYAGDILRVYCSQSAGQNDVVVVEIEYPFNIHALVGPKGDPGDDGYSGFDFLTGNGAPGSSIGQDGDVYLDNITGDFYKKVSGSWSKQTNLKGPMGSTPYILTTNNAMTNVNASTSGTQLSGFKTTPIFNSDSNLFSVSSDGITVSEDGVYEVYCSIYQTSSTARTNAGIQITVDGTNTGRYGAQAYIRSTSDHNESSASILDAVYVSANQKIGVKAYMLAASGTVTAPEDTAVFWIKKVG